jgi:hypothetical protein
MLIQVARMACALCLLALLWTLPAANNAQAQTASEKAEVKKSAKKSAGRAARSTSGGVAATTPRRGDGGEMGPSASGMWERHDARNGY